MVEPSSKRLCQALNRAGEPCARRAGDDGYCTAHGPNAQNLRELGKRGGVASVRSRLGIDPEVADGRLRKKAKARLEALLDSPDETKALAAARSLYSYSPTRAPADEDEAAAADTVSALKAILRKLTELPDAKRLNLLDKESFVLLGRCSSGDPELAQSFLEFTEKLAEISGRRGPAVSVKDGRLVAEGRPVPTEKKPAVPDPVPESNGAPVAPPVPPLAAHAGPGPRAQQEAAAKSEIREKIAWEFRQDWDREIEPAELEERVRRAAKEALEDEQDAAA